MGKLETGPDWTDVESLMRSIGGLHTGRVGLTVLPRGIGFNGGLEVGCSILLDVLPGSSLPEGLSVIKNWPCASHATFPGHCFALLLELDHKIGQTYENKLLWE